MDNSKIPIFQNKSKSFCNASVSRVKGERRGTAPHVGAWVLQVVWAQKVFHRLAQVVLQEPPDQLVVVQAQRAVHGREAAVDGHVRHGVAQLPETCINRRVSSTLRFLYNPQDNEA